MHSKELHFKRCIGAQNRAFVTRIGGKAVEDQLTFWKAEKAITPPKTSKPPVILPTVEDAIQSLRRRYERHGAIVLREVASFQGFLPEHEKRRRRIDAVVIELRPSREYLRRAFEIKLSRNDFLRDVRNPDKWQWIVERFHEFWYIAPAGVVDLKRLPDCAGWLELKPFKFNGGTGTPFYEWRLVTRKEAPRHKPQADDELIATLIVAVLRRKVSD